LSGRHARTRPFPLHRALCSVVGIAALVTAAAGAVDLGHDRQATQQITGAATRLAAADTSTPARARIAHARQRAHVMEASRGWDRSSLAATDAAQARAAERSAALRARRLARVAEAVASRGAEIERERRRRLALQRQRARQQRLERLNAWVMPVSGYDITATFGSGGDLWSSTHTGLDLAAPEGAPVGSAAAGRVTSTGYDGSYGNKVVVTHNDGTQTWYCHLSGIYVGSGETVAAGTTIGAVGSTGNSTGPHLHLEVRPGGGAPVDPYAYLQAQDAL
jgi:murein DD-endopeptidase MepM/ murein hydrolase activator NlpD